MTTTTVDLRITPLCNCSGCIEAAKVTLDGIAGVKFLYHRNGKFTIKTSIHPQRIQDALQPLFPGQTILVSTRINHPDPLSPLENPPIQGPLNIHDLAKELAEAYGGNGLQNVEYTQSTNVKINFNDQPSTSGSATDGPDSKDVYVNVAPQRQYEPNTFGGYNEDNGYGYGPPPIRRAEAEGYGYGYPVATKNRYMEDDYSGACCTILLFLFYGFLILLLVTNM